MHLIPQTATWTPCRAPIPAITHFVRLGFSPKKKNVLNVSNRFSMDCASFRRKRRIICICSIKDAVFKYFYTFFSRCFVIKRNRISNTSIKRYSETGSPWQVSLSKLKYWVVVPPFMTHDCWSFNKISIQVIIFFENQNFLRQK